MSKTKQRDTIATLRRQLKKKEAELRAATANRTEVAQAYEAFVKRRDSLLSKLNMAAGVLTWLRSSNAAALDNATRTYIIALVEKDVRGEIRFSTPAIGTQLAEATMAMHRGFPDDPAVGNLDVFASPEMMKLSAGAVRKDGRW